jgi:TM2 domain-containing membrane protein YozV
MPEGAESVGIVKGAACGSTGLAGSASITGSVLFAPPSLESGSLSSRIRIRGEKTASNAAPPTTLMMQPKRDNVSHRSTWEMPVSDGALRSAPDPNAGSMMMMTYDANKKSAGIAYLLWFFLGMLGVHRFYLGASGTGTAILVLTVVSILLSLAVIGLVLLVIPLVWWCVDAFLIPGMARNYNNDLITRLRTTRA